MDLARLYQAFDPAPLTPNQQTSLYVDFSEVRGEDPKSKIVDSLAAHIRLSRRTTCQLLSGHRGSGKSTELYRLQEHLRTGTPRIFAVFCDIDEALNRNDLAFPDLLLAIVRQLAAQLEALRIKLAPGYFLDRFQELKEFLGREVQVDRLELGDGLNTLVGSLKRSPISRRLIRDALERKVDSLVHAANEVISEARNALQPLGYSDLAILIDNTDHLARRTGKDAEEFPGESLFIGRFPEVSGFACHTVYAAPLALVFSVRNRELLSLYGRETPIVGISKVRTTDGKPHAAGVEKFREMIHRRFELAKADSKGVIDAAVCDTLIQLSAGQPLELCALLRDAMVRGLPISAKTVEVLKRQAARAYERWLERSHWQIIEEVRAGQQPVPDESNRTTLRDLIEGRAILYYQNEREWWGVNPLVGEAPARL